MDFLCELILEVILEGFFGLTIKNPKVKTWVKTAVFLLFSESVASVGVFAAIQAYRTGSTVGAVICGVTALALGIGFLVGAIYSHKLDWKDKMD